MKHFTLLFLFGFLFLSAAAQKPLIGLSSQVMTGKYRFPSQSLYNQHPFEAFNSLSWGVYAQLHLTKHFSLQPEVSFYDRKIQGTGRYQYLLVMPTQNKPVEYELGGTQQVSEVALLGNFRFLKGPFRPAGLIGFSSVFKRADEIEQFEYYDGKKLEANLMNKEADVTFIMGAGATYQFGRHWCIQGSFRYSIGQTTFKSPERYITRLVISNAFVHRYIAQLGVGYNF